MSYQSLWQSLSTLYEPQEAQAIVRMVLEEKYNMTLTDIVCGGIDNLSETQLSELQSIMQRLQTGEPVQYVLGYAYFCGRKFHVEPGVLIPRPETEELCRLAIQSSKFKVQSMPQIIDIGTCSGCIAITLALEMPEADVYAIDISDRALQIARGNAKTLGAKVTFIKADILSGEGLDSIVERNCQSSNINGITSPRPKGEELGDKSLLIISNPPYIANKERKSMSKNVLEHEPSLALFVPDDDPLLFYRAIGRQAVKSLEPDGRLCFEINPLFADELKSMLIAQGFSNVDVIDDDYGKRRYTIATL